MKLLRTLLPAVAVLVVPVLGVGPRLAAEEFESKALYKKVVKSTVFIVTPLKGGYAMGSGSLIDLNKKLILTNYHVVDDEDIVFVQFPLFVKGEMVTDKRKYMDNIPAGNALKGKVLYRDKSRDLALVEVPTVPSGTSALRLAKSSVERGEDVWNVGSPGDVDQVFSVTHGTVRAVANEKHRVGGGDPSSVFTLNCKVVTTTNPINGGDSGGPLVNKKGELIAVTESSRVGASLVNFFVDVTEVRALLADKKIQLSEPGEDNPEKPIPKKGQIVPKKDAVPSKKEPLKDPATPDKDPGVVPVTPPAKEPGAAKSPPKKDNGEAAAPSEADEKKANDLLRRAKLFATDPDNKDYYRSRLKEITSKYPGTAASKEAEKLLKEAN